MRQTLAAIFVVAWFPAAAFGQANATKPPVPHNQIVSANPFGLLIRWYNAEYERKIGEATTLGVSASQFVDDETGNAAVLARWYPQRAALDGFYVGARAGVFRIQTHSYDYWTPPSDPNYPMRPTNPMRIYREHRTVAPGLGLEIGYNWLLGPEQNFSIGLGFGLTRMLRSADSRDNYFMPSVIPHVRLVNIGIAF